MSCFCKSMAKIMPFVLLFCIFLQKSVCTLQTKKEDGGYHLPSCCYFPDLVAVELGLVWAIDFYADVVGLFFAQLGQFHAELVQVQAGYLFV